MKNQPFRPDEEHARALDRQDDLSGFRARFHNPVERIYFEGNSLGLLSMAAEERLLTTLEEWKHLGVQSWMDANAQWMSRAESLGDRVAPLVGAGHGEVVATGTTTVNIHALISTFYRPVGDRVCILGDALNFPSDNYALGSQAALKGFDPSENLRLVGGDGRMPREDELIAAMTDDVALILFPAVTFRDCELLDIRRLTAAAHEREILIGFDLSHSAGAVPHQLHDDGVDFAMWCGYKYLNGGPGCSAFLFVHERHHGSSPGMAGWFGTDPGQQFNMSNEFVGAANARAWQLSTPAMLALAPLEAAVDINLEAGIDAIRTKSTALTEYMINLIDHMKPRGITVGSPRESSRRGAHIALEHDEAVRVVELLSQRGVVVDARPPNVMRAAPTALYNTFHEVWTFVRHLVEVCAS